MSKWLSPLMFTLLVATLYLAALIPYAGAVTYTIPPPDSEPPTNPYVLALDPDDLDDYIENEGDPVLIIAFVGSGNMVPYEIRVFRSPECQSYDELWTGEWILVKTITVNTTGWYCKTHEDISTPDRTWWKAEIYIGGKPNHGKATYFVIPQVPLGVAAILAACFAGLGVKRLRRIREETL